MSFIVNQILPFISLLDIDRIVDIFWWLLLLIDCVVYSAVSYIYSIFQIVAHLKFNVISTWTQPLVNRIEALIMVLILFKLGMSFIQYMVNPESFSDKNKGGTSLLINIVICAILLITYQFLFTLFNELSMLIIGYSDGYEFTVLKEIADVTSEDGGDEAGLLGRFIFGDEFDSSKFGDQLAGITLFSFLKDRNVKDDDGNPVTVSKKAATNTLGQILDESDFFYVTNLASSIYRSYSDGDLDEYGSVEYRYPLLSTAAGIYLAYVLVILTIEVAIRMFKLIILEVTAPIAIITTIQDGLNASVFKKFYTQYFSVYVSLFIRVLVVYLTSALINMFSQNIDSLDTGSGITSTFVFVIIIVSLFTFAKKLPSFIDSLFGTQTDTGDGKAGFKGLMKSMGGALGVGIGAAVGVSSGIQSGAGFAGTFHNALAGGINGGLTGFRANNVADFFNNTADNSNRSRQRANNIATQGGMGRYLGAGIERTLGISAGVNQRVSKYQNQENALDTLDKARKEAIQDQDDGNGIKYGSDINAYVNSKLEQDYQNDNELKQIALNEEAARNRWAEQDKRTAPDADTLEARQRLLNTFNENRKTRQDALKTDNEEKYRNAWNSAYSNAESSKITNAERNARAIVGRNGRKNLDTKSQESIDGAKKVAHANAEKLMSTGRFNRAHRRDGTGNGQSSQ